MTPHGIDGAPWPSLKLDEETGTSALLRDWLRGMNGFPGAATEWNAFLAAPTAPGPIWRDAAWRESWLDGLREDLPDAAARKRAEIDVAALAAGTYDVVVTGQQPGFLGGPLYTLFKVAAAVAAARLRTEAGRPTVALFWSGDDDDDRHEAFAPRVYDFRRRALLTAEEPADAEGAMVGAAPAANWARAGAAWLDSVRHLGPQAAALADLWQEGRAAGLTWGRLQRRALLRCFAGTGLLAVSGDDDRLHASAATLYADWLPRLDALAAAAAAGGEALFARGFHAQIGERSLIRPLHRRDGRFRRGDPEPGAVVDAAALRPGVLLRSPLQDALFRPAGVVAGPGEIAYLEQLRPVYAALEVARPALLPRLFGHLGSAVGLQGAAVPATESRATEWTESTLSALRETLVARHADVYGPLDSEEVVRRTERWRGLLKDLAARAESPAAAPPPPRWEQPGDVPQERVLATYWAVAVWGEPLVAAVLDAAQSHFQSGAHGEWRRWVLPVRAPESEE